MFVHFGPNTFTDVEWGDGREDPGVFNPSDLDCRQWAATARAAGMKGIIVTAKHHDGFCLWPSNFSTHTVRESPWKGGDGDVLRELSEACREYGIGFGVYLSPWDRNHPAYGSPEYNQVYANTLNEVLSGYGPVFEQWFDGANGLVNEGKTPPPYDWNMFHEVVYRNQPGAVIFSDIGPGCRWVGNERGVAGETNWSTLNTKGYTPGLGAPPVEVLNSGVQGGEAWVPAETDVSIRPGWFYSPATDNKVKSVETLMDIWYTSVGRNSNLLLNVPPDRRGRIHPIDSLRLMEFRAAREEAFGQNLLAEAKVSASAEPESAKRVLDNDYDTWWAGSGNAPALEFDTRRPITFNRFMIQEFIPLGQRVTSFGVEYLDEATGDWTRLASATTIGYKRILRFAPVSARKIRVVFNAPVTPVISTVEVYNSTL
jgi:alpha-L-fucosidase